MTHKNTLTQQIAEQIKNDMIKGYHDSEGTKQYPTLKEAAEHYNVSYDSLKQKARHWNWKQKRENYQNEVSRKIAEKKKSEEISEVEAEEIVVEDIKFNRAANKLRRAAVREIDRIINKIESGEFHPSSSFGYNLMNLGKALESAQKVSKTAAGEASEITASQLKVESPENTFDRVNKLLEYIEKGNKDKREDI